MNVRCEQGCVAHCRQRKVIKYTRRKWRRTAVPGAPDFCMMYRVVGRPARVTTEGGADHSGVVVLKNTGGWSSIALVVRGEVHDRVFALRQRAVSCLGEVAAELQMIQRGGVDSDDEGDGALSDGEEEGEEAEEAEDEDRGIILLSLVYRRRS